MSILYFIVSIFILLLILPDTLNKINLTSKGLMMFFTIIIPHIFILTYYLLNFSSEPFIFSKIIVIITVITFSSYIWIKFSINPYASREFDTIALGILLGGRRLLLFSVYASVINGIFYFILSKRMNYTLSSSFTTTLFSIDLIITTALILSLYINGLIRILITSHRLSLVKKIIIASTFYIPLLNLLEIWYLCRSAYLEFDHETYNNS